MAGKTENIIHSNIPPKAVDVAYKYNLQKHEKVYYLNQSAKQLGKFSIGQNKNSKANFYSYSDTSCKNFFS